MTNHRHDGRLEPSQVSDQTYRKESCDERKYESLSAGELREVDQSKRDCKGISALRKDELVQRMLEEGCERAGKQIEDKKANLDSWTVESRQTVFWKCLLTVMDSSAVIIICRVRMMCMYPLHRSAALI